MARYQPQNPWLWGQTTRQDDCKDELPLQERIRCTRRSLAIVQHDYSAILELYANLFSDERSGDSASRRGLQISIVRCEMRMEELRKTLAGLQTALRHAS